VDQGLPRPAAGQGRRRPAPPPRPHHRHRHRVLALPPRAQPQGDKEGRPTPAMKRPRAPRRCASPSGLGSTTSGAPQSDSRMREDQPGTSTDAKWGHFKPSAWGQCKSSVRPSATGGLCALSGVGTCERRSRPRGCGSRPPGSLGHTGSPNEMRGGRRLAHAGGSTAATARRIGSRTGPRDGPWKATSARSAGARRRMR
jgi:hypothetical protein